MENRELAAAMAAYKKAASDIDPRRARARELIDPWSERRGARVEDLPRVRGLAFLVAQAEESSGVRLGAFIFGGAVQIRNRFGWDIYIRTDGEHWRTTVIASGSIRHFPCVSFRLAVWQVIGQLVREELSKGDWQ